MTTQNTTAPSDPSPDGCTILQAPGRRLAKRIVSIDPLQVQPYDETRLFNASETPLYSLDGLLHVLPVLVQRTNACLIRGGLIGAPKQTDIRRLLHGRGDAAPTLRDVPRS